MMLGCKMKIPLGLLLVLALMGCTAAYDISLGFENELNIMTEEMVPSGERYMFGGVQAANRDFMSSKPSIQDYLATAVVIAVPTNSEYKIYTDPLRVGQAVEVVYLAPSEGSLSVSLESAKGDIAFSINTQYEANRKEKNIIFVEFKSKTANGQQFSNLFCGCSLWAGLVNLQIEMGTDAFIVRVNGAALGKHPYKFNLNYSIVTKVKWSYCEAGATKKAHLKFLGIDIEL